MRKYFIATSKKEGNENTICLHPMERRDRNYQLQQNQDRRVCTWRDVHREMYIERYVRKLRGSTKIIYADYVFTRNIISGIKEKIRRITQQNVNTMCKDGCILHCRIYSKYKCQNSSRYPN